VRSEIERLETATRARGLTVREITRGLGVSEKKARQLLMILKESGRLLVSRKSVETVDGRIVLSPCYSIKSEGYKVKITKGHVILFSGFLQSQRRANGMSELWEKLWANIRWMGIISLACAKLEGRCRGNRGAGSAQQREKRDADWVFMGRRDGAPAL
jgi:hypothetical protein